MGTKREKRHYRKVDLSNLRRESYKELTPEAARFRWRLLNHEYRERSQEAEAAMKELLQFAETHPEVFKDPR